MRYRLEYGWNRYFDISYKERCKTLKEVRKIIKRLRRRDRKDGWATIFRDGNIIESVTWYSVK